MFPKDRYASFLLRLQWTQDGDHPALLISMQSTKTGFLHRFSNLEALVTFLRQEFGEREERIETG